MNSFVKFIIRFVFTVLTLLAYGWITQMIWNEIAASFDIIKISFRQSFLIVFLIWQIRSCVDFLERLWEKEVDK